VGIEGLDTRALTRHIRDAGAQQGVISTLNLDPKSLAVKAKASPPMVGLDLAREVTCQQPFLWEEGEWRWEGKGAGKGRDQSPVPIRKELPLSDLRELIA
jgi:carbamoylphosphate synthase small subunit